MSETLEQPPTKELTPVQIRADEMRERMAHKTQTGKWEVYLNSPITEEEDLQRKEIIAREPRSVLVVCFAGKNRSKFIAHILNKRGYKAVNIGAGNEKGGAKPLLESDILESKPEAIICMDEHVKENFVRQVEKLEIAEEIEDTPIRTIGFGDNSAFYETNPERKITRILELEDYVGKVLDRLGFVKVQHSATPNSLK